MFGPVLEIVSSQRGHPLVYFAMLDQGTFTICFFFFFGNVSTITEFWDLFRANEVAIITGLSVVESTGIPTTLQSTHNFPRIPVFFISNVRSLTPKVDELEWVLKHNQVDICKRKPGYQICLWTLPLLCKITPLCLAKNPDYLLCVCDQDFLQCFPSALRSIAIGEGSDSISF